MRKLISCCFLLICLGSFSQTIRVDKPEEQSAQIKNIFTASGSPYIDAKFVSMVSGSPFFNDKMMRGIIVSSDGTEYRNILIRLNLMESQVNFLNDNKVEMVAGMSIREVTLLDSINQKNFLFVNANSLKTTDKPELGYYQLLQKGKAELYTQYRKTIKETRQFNAATYEQSIETNLIFFVLVDGQWKKINKIKDLPSLLGDKKNEVEEYIKSKGFSKYKQEDMESVIKYYNSLFEGK